MDLATSQYWFPLEIYENIIDFVAGEDVDRFSSIQACALVSHTFLPLARKHLFASITLNDIGWTRRHHPNTQKFVQLISRTEDRT